MSLAKKYAALWNSGEMSAEELFDAYAHELAEKIRNSEWLQDWTDGHMGDCYLAADLIDPEVK